MQDEIRDLLVLSDVDNTLLTVRGGIPACNRAVIDLFNLLGGHFSVATGRTPAAVKSVLDGMELTAPGVCCGGSVIYDFAQDKMIKEYTLNRDAAMSAIADVMREFPDVGVEIMSDCGKIYMVRTNRYTQMHLKDENIGCVVGPLSNAPEQWEKVLFAADGITINRLREYMAERDYGKDIYFLATNTTYFEIMPAGVSKATGMQDVCAICGISNDNTVVMGDYYNDIELMCAAGYSVAMANAPKEVRMVADEVTSCRCFEGGVAEALYKIIRQHESGYQLEF